MANIREIAKLAGVSVSTVSRVLNNHPYVTADKREAVMKAINQLHYTPNRNAVNLATGATRMIGVLLPFTNHPYYSGMLEGISARALKQHYDIVLCQTNYDVKEEERALQMLRDKLVDGIIVCSKQGEWKLFESYAPYGPIVVCEYNESKRLSSVYANFYASTLEAMNILIKQGHRRIGYCLGRPNSYNSKKRLAAYEEALQSVGETVRSEYCFFHCYQFDQGAEVLRSIMKLPERPTALLVAGDQAACGIVIEARKQGLEVPADLSVIGFDNIPISKVLELSTFDYASYEAGTTAFDTFYRQYRLQGNVDVEKHELPCQFIARSTVGPVSANP